MGAFSVSSPVMEGNSGAIVLVVAGPTASGKSALAADVAEAFGGMVINADSMQVYRQFSVLTARPTAAECARAPHRLYGVLDVAEGCSAAAWQAMAVAEIARARDAGLLPIVCGGTGLYLKALIEGLSPMPPVPAVVRRTVRARLAAEGAPALHAELRDRDAPAAARLHPNDGQRIARTLEVLEASGRPLAEWQAMPPDLEPMRSLRFRRILLAPPRRELHAAIDARVPAMVAEGALAEVEAVKRAGLDPDLPGMKALGLSAFMAYLDGAMELEAAIGAVQQATRRYAKRQETWFRNQFIADVGIATKYSSEIRDIIFSFIRQKVLTLVE